MKWFAMMVAGCLIWVAAPPVQAEMAHTTVYQATLKGPGKEVGTVTFVDSRYGLLITPNLKGLKPGLHGAHIHVNPSCAPSRIGDRVVPAGGAGGHYDPEAMGKHEGPYGNGHLGDLPNLTVEQDGVARMPVLAPRLLVADLVGKALVIHAGPDRYNDANPGGERAYCGVIE